MRIGSKVEINRRGGKFLETEGVKKDFFLSCLILSNRPQIGKLEPVTGDWVTLRSSLKLQNKIESNRYIF